MSARTVRRSFAAPFVVTAAASASATLAACVMSTTPPRNTPTLTTVGSGSGSQQAIGSDGTVSVSNPPRPVETALPKPSPNDAQWSVTRTAAGCVAQIPFNCPKPVDGMPIKTCNPPPPQQVTCPEPLRVVGQQIEVFQSQATSTCYTYAPQAAPTCPPNVMCNPPAPEQVAIACPK